MNNYIVLDKRKSQKKIMQIIAILNMTNVLKNRRTCIWKNDDMQISIDKYIIRILIFDKKDYDFIKKYFEKTW